MKINARFLCNSLANQPNFIMWDQLFKLGYKAATYLDALHLLKLIEPLNMVLLRQKDPILSKLMKKQIDKMFHYLGT